MADILLDEVYEKFKMDEVVCFLKEGRTSPKGNYSIDELDLIISHEDNLYFRASAHCQTIIDDSKGDLLFILDKYVFYKNIFIVEEEKLEDTNESKKLFLQELCSFLEKHIVLMCLIKAGYKRDIADDYLRWKKE